MVSKTFAFLSSASLFYILASSTPLLGAPQLRTRKTPTALYISCIGGPMQKDCTPAVDGAWSGNRTQSVTTEHQFFTAGNCKLTWWTDNGNILIKDKQVYIDALGQMDDSCSQFEDTGIISGSRLTYVGSPYGTDYMVIEAKTVFD